LRSELGLVVKSGFIYVPLLFDPDIAEDIADTPESGGVLNNRTLENSNTVVELDGRQFIKSVNIHSVLANYDQIDKDYYEQLKKECLQRCDDSPTLEAVSPHGKLLTILFKIMPYFIRKRRGFEGRRLKRRPLSEEELLDLVYGKIDIPQRFIEQADKYLDSESLRHKLNDLDKLEQTFEPLPEGPVTGAALRQWLDNALQVQIATRERARLERDLLERERFGESKRNHIATLLYIAETGSFEIDGFGFTRIDSSDEYLIYKRTEDYILKDYYAQSYRFPSCSVAVATMRPFRPLVLEHYKHPFLPGHAPKQEICLREYNWPEEFSAENIVRLLEAGINALLYGYDARRRNGYHSLDRTWQYIQTIGFDEYRV